MKTNQLPSTSKQQQKQIKTVMYHLSISTWKKIHYIKHDMTTQQLWITKINYTGNVL
jgi:GH18 family chitinase